MAESAEFYLKLCVSRPGSSGVVQGVRIMKRNRVVHRSSGTPIAGGPLEWGITPFEGSLYVRRKYLLTDGFRVNHIPGFCPYKFF
jgi:hypothetical protein